MAKIYLDPGHGGHDPGAVGNNLREKDLVLTIALRIRDELLARYQCQVRMSRATDIFRELSWRANDANAWGADLFVSVHCNAGGGTGFETYRHRDAPARTRRAQQTLHTAILDAMRGEANVRDRGVKTAGFLVLRATAMAAVLTENLFVDTRADAQLLTRPEFLRAAARGHADGIAQVLDLERKPTPEPDPDPRRYQMLVYARPGVDAAAVHFADQYYRPCPGVITSNADEARAAVERGETVIAVGAGGDDVDAARELRGANRVETAAEVGRFAWSGWK